MKQLRMPLALLFAAVIALSSCSINDAKDAVNPSQSENAISLTPNVSDGASDVKVSTFVRVLAEDGNVTSAKLTTADGSTQIDGRISETGWRADSRLEPGTAYKLAVTGVGEDGKEATVTRAFTTQALSLDQQTYPSVAPLQGETVGVGMPVIVTFDLPVKNRALFEKHMKVSTDNGVTGSWTWFSDREAHFRPEQYWPARTKVNVRLNLNSLPAGGGIYGQQDQDVSFEVGQKVVSTVDIGKHRLTYTVDDKKVRTIPVTTGDDSHRTRQGIKVIMEKFAAVDMDAATTGVDSEDPGYYNLSDVQWAMRLTTSGEFMHAAPWSVSSQGNANVSHGCTGMSTTDAKWLYDRSRRGDVVEYVDSPRPLEDRNGWTDWNVPWTTWTAGSALQAAAADQPADDGVVD
ncbi:L,D-transpeptidase [Aeromicrobium wangtongii]|uniref:L,D-transpeptidase n=1 Tax=Aeromicrobium wangtongii TaxID=2969247 RepID=UPI0020171AEA|nr:Ig-like domain-containing protein [Aeromicrobium wangtongii]MCL3818428.1 Ig-like domain-containing protein [Aeromicrobium wangtongii]